MTSLRFRSDEGPAPEVRPARGPRNRALPRGRMERRPRRGPGMPVAAALLMVCAVSFAAAGGSGIQKKREVLARPDRESDLIRGYDALSYRLELDFPLLSTRFEGVMTLTAKSLRDDLPSMAVHSGYLDIRSVDADGASAAWEQQGSLLVVPLLNRPSAGDTFTVRVRYEAAPEYAGFFQNDTCAYTMSEPSSARYWFPCKDVPWDKAAAEIIATVPAGVEVASNGRLIGRSRDNGTETFRWKTDLPVATYLMCVSMSRYYSRWTDRYPISDGDSVDCMNYVFRKDSAKARADFLNLPKAMEIFCSLFGRYPFEKYGMAEVTKDFNYGGMEHQTMTTVNAGWFKGNRGSEDGFVHEMAHSWWGDSVTLDDWPDIWLNEGFATYCEALFYEHTAGWERYREEIAGQRVTYFAQALKADFAVYDPPEGELFNWGIEYCKGSLILHMLRRVVGEDHFGNGLRSYYRAHRYGNASRDDLQSAFEAESGMDLEWFFSEWLDTGGCLSLRYDWNAVETGIGKDAGSGCALVLDMAQDPSGRTYQMPLDLRAFGPGSATADTTVWVLDESERVRWDLPFRPDSLALDPEGWIVLKTERGSTAVDSTGNRSDPFTLRPNYPNPFREVTSIEVELRDSAASGVLHVYNCIGERVRSLGTIESANGPVQAVEWDGTDDSGRSLPSGIYIVRLESGRVSSARKVVLRR
jgi:aminopeptidase N